MTTTVPEQLILQMLSELRDDMKSLKNNVMSKEWGGRQEWRLDDLERRVESVETQLAVSKAISQPWKSIGEKILWLVIGGVAIAILQAAGVTLAL